MTNQLCLYPHFQEYLNKADNYPFHVIIHMSRPHPSEKAIGWTCESGQLILILGLCLKIRISATVAAINDAIVCTGARVYDSGTAAD